MKGTKNIRFNLYGTLTVPKTWKPQYSDDDRVTEAFKTPDGILIAPVLSLRVTNIDTGKTEELTLTDATAKYQIYPHDYEFADFIDE